MHRSTFFDRYYNRTESFSYSELIDKPITFAYHDINQATQDNKSNLQKSMTRTDVESLETAGLILKTMAAVNRRTLIFTPLLSKVELVTQFLSIQSKVSLLKLKTGDLMDHEWTQLGFAMEKFAKKNIFINDSGIFNKKNILDNCQLIRMVKNLNLVIFVLGDCSKYHKKFSLKRTNKISKLIAKRYNVQVVIFSTLEYSQIEFALYSKKVSGRWIVSRPIDIYEALTDEQQAQRDAYMEYLSKDFCIDENEGWDEVGIWKNQASDIREEDNLENEDNLNENDFDEDDLEMCDIYPQPDWWDNPNLILVPIKKEDV